MGALFSWSRHLWLMVVPADGRPDNVAAMRVGVDEHGSFFREMPRGRLAGGSVLGTMCQPLLEVSIHGGAVNWCQLMVGSGGSQGFPSMAVRMASSAVMPWAAAESR